MAPPTKGEHGELDWDPRLRCGMGEQRDEQWWGSSPRPKNSVPPTPVGAPAGGRPADRPRPVPGHGRDMDRDRGEWFGPATLAAAVGSVTRSVRRRHAGRCHLDPGGEPLGNRQRCSSLLRRRSGGRSNRCTRRGSSLGALDPARWPPPPSRFRCRPMRRCRARTMCTCRAESPGVHHGLGRSSL